TLREWKLVCPKGPLDLVFPNGKGRVESHANIANRGWYSLQVATGLIGGVGRPQYCPHRLQAFFALWGLLRRLSPQLVQALLRHSTKQMTFDVSGHLLPSLEDDHAKFAAGELAVVGS